MPFLVKVEVHDLGHVFSNLTISTGGGGGASVFSTLVPLLIQISMLFLLPPSLLFGVFIASSKRGVGRLRYQRWQGFFDGVVIGVSGKEGL